MLNSFRVSATPASTSGGQNPDRDKSGTTGCEKREVLAKGLENQALGNAETNTTERKGFSDRINRWRLA